MLSQGELHWWYFFRWDDDVHEIREQFALDLDTTRRIAAALGFRHPAENGTDKVMTTDLLVIRRDGTKHAYSVKYSRKILDKKREVEKLMIEKKYWESEGVEFSLVFSTDLNMTYIRNIMDVVAVYDKDDIYDAIGLARHMIAHGLIKCDMQSAPLDYRRIVKEERIDKIWMKKGITSLQTEIL